MNPYVSASERRQLPRVRHRPGPNRLQVDHARMGAVVVDAAACTGCRLCLRVCPAQALVMTAAGKARMIADDAGCIGCGDCVAVCAPRAVMISRPLRYEGYYKTIGRDALAAPRLY